MVVMELPLGGEVYEPEVVDVVVVPAEACVTRKWA
jgi:hypothetical protein